MNRIAVIAAHPDDEVLGCGGTIARRARGGADVSTLIVAEGATSRDNSRDASARKEQIQGLQDAARKANALLGVRSVAFGSLPDNRLDSIDLLDVVKLVEGFLEQHRPSLVMTHHPGDLNIDHQIVSRAVVTACRPLPGAPTRCVLFFEVPSSSEWPTSAHDRFAPNWFEDVGQTLSAKIAALRCYESEMRPWPHPRSYEAVEALARWRGASAGYNACEAFFLARNLVSGDADG